VVALGIDRRLVMETPVDTGQARANWLISINTPRFDTGPPMTAAAALVLAKSAISAARSGDTVYISNNLPYIAALNRGRSSQAPAGYIQNIIRNARAALPLRFSFFAPRIRIGLVG
jgi:hypothetical protein